MADLVSGARETRLWSNIDTTSPVDPKSASITEFSQELPLIKVSLSIGLLFSLFSDFFKKKSRNKIALYYFLNQLLIEIKVCSNLSCFKQTCLGAKKRRLHHSPKKPVESSVMCDFRAKHRRIPLPSKPSKSPPTRSELLAFVRSFFRLSCTEKAKR